MSEYKKLREEYREERRAGTLKRRAALPSDSEYLKKKDPEYRKLKRLERAKKAEKMRERFLKKNSENSEYALRKNPDYRALKRKERELRIEERKKKRENENKQED